MAARKQKPAPAPASAPLEPVHRTPAVVPVHMVAQGGAGHGAWRAKALCGAEVARPVTVMVPWDHPRLCAGCLAKSALGVQRGMPVAQPIIGG